MLREGLQIHCMTLPENHRTPSPYNNTELHRARPVCRQLCSSCLSQSHRFLERRSLLRSSCSILSCRDSVFLTTIQWTIGRRTRYAHCLSPFICSTSTSTSTLQLTDLFLLLQPFRASQLRPPPGSRLPAPNVRPGTLNEITDAQNNVRAQPSMLPQAGVKRTHTGSGTFFPWHRQANTAPRNRD